MRVDSAAGPRRVALQTVLLRMARSAELQPLPGRLAVPEHEVGGLVVESRVGPAIPAGKTQRRVATAAEDLRIVAASAFVLLIPRRSRVPLDEVQRVIAVNVGHAAPPLERF